MKIYADEVAYWNEITARYIQKNGDYNANSQHIVDAAVWFAAQMILERRKLKVLEVPA